MSREMLNSENWLHLYDIGGDYLDKPPFIFWVSAFSMKLLGVSTWAYKLPSVLFAIWAIYALYRFVLLFYDKETALISALIFASCQATLLITNDIKTDTILMSFGITAFWQISAWLYKKETLAWVWGAICIGGAMLTKGPIGLLVIGFGFLPHFIIKKQYKNLLRWQYLPMLILIGLVLFPMSYGLYTQFDLHPEKMVNGSKSVSGLRFFYWTQSFGRITGESSWNNNAGFTFLYSNLLWGMIPLTVFFIMGTIKGFIKLIKRCTQTEWISTAAVILAYFSLGLSKFQLPHYIYVVLPFICLLTARYFLSTKEFFGHKFRILRVIHNTLIYVAFLLFPIGVFYAFPEMANIHKVILTLAILLIIILIILEKKQILTLLPTAIFLVVIGNFILHFVFYPNLIPFQKEYTLAKEIKGRNLNLDKIAKYNINVLRSCDFLLQHDIPLAKTYEFDNYEYLIVDERGLEKVEELKKPYSIIYEGQGYPVSRLKIGFLNPNTRNDFTDDYYITKFN